MEPILNLSPEMNTDQFIDDVLRAHRNFMERKLNSESFRSSLRNDLQNKRYILGDRVSREFMPVLAKDIIMFKYRNAVGSYWDFCYEYLQLTDKEEDNLLKFMGPSQTFFNVKNKTPSPHRRDRGPNKASSPPRQTSTPIKNPNLDTTVNELDVLDAEDDFEEDFLTPENPNAAPQDSVQDIDALIADETFPEDPLIPQDYNEVIESPDYYVSESPTSSPVKEFLKSEDSQGDNSSPEIPSSQSHTRKKQKLMSWVALPAGWSRLAI